MENNEYILKLSGKVNIPQPLEIGHNYEVKIKGSITGDARDDNENGTVDTSYKFQPILVEVITPQGQKIKAKDPRKMSQKLRGIIFIDWQESKVQQDFDEFYLNKMNEIISNYH